jgi:hypothetical protein
MRPLHTDSNGVTQFEGRTAEEAVARARAALGESSGLRCWKTRRGGVGGFFAREVFVASVTPPPGSEPARGRAGRLTAKRTSEGPDGAPEDDSALPGAPDEGARWTGSDSRGPFELTDSSGSPADLLSGLVEATSDQVSLRSVPIPADAFDQVLAEAEAALVRDLDTADTPLPPRRHRRPPSQRLPHPKGSLLLHQKRSLLSRTTGRPVPGRVAQTAP